MFDFIPRLIVEIKSTAGKREILQQVEK